MALKSEQQIHAEIRRLRHQLDRHKLTRIQTELEAARFKMGTSTAR
jgi:outer membrane protein TolC